MRILTLLLLLLFPAVFCGVAQELSPKLRTWEAVNGKKVEAQFVSNSDGQVTLRGKNGKTFKVPINKLSQADQDFILADSASPSAKEEPKSAEEIAAIARLAREWKEKVESRRNDGDRYYYEKGTDTLYSGKYYELEGRPEGYIEGTIKDGRFEGIFTIYRPSGSRMGAIRFKAGEQIEGSEKWWNDKGEPVESQRQAMGKEEAKEAKNRASVTELLLNMKQVSNALHSYAFDHDRRFPASLADLIPDYIEESVDKKLLSMECADGSRKPWHYVEGLTTESEAGKVILYSPEPIEGKWIVGFVDGSGQIMEEEKFRALLKDVKLPSGKGDSSSTGPRGNATNILVTQFASLSPGGNELNVDYGGQSRRLMITVPKKLGRQGEHPVLFCFHGAGGKADGPSRRWSSHADKRGLIVISAEAVQPLAKWNFRDGFHAEEHDDVGFVLQVVEALISGKLADPGAVYATGHSSGGLFCYRLAKQTDVFAALSPMSCGMVKGAHDPDGKTKPVPILQVIGDQDKSFKGSSNPKVTMYSAARRIDVWRKFNQCAPEPVVIEKGKEIEVHTYAGPSGMEVALCKVQGQGHFIRSDLRDSADSLALDFLLKHKKG